MVFSFLTGGGLDDFKMTPGLPVSRRPPFE